MTVTLTNNFHNTSCRVRPDKDGKLTLRQAGNAWRKLCGIESCMCGDVAGARPNASVQIDEARCELISDQMQF